MRRSVIIWLVVAASLVIIGCAIIGGTMAMLTWDFTKLSTNKYTTNEYEVTERFQGISIITDTADVTFSPSESEKTLVVCQEHQKVAHSVTVEDGTLVIRLVDTRKWYEYIGINFGKTQITVCLPQSEYGKIAVQASTGDVTIQKNFKFESIDISLSTGDVKNYASASDILKIKTTTGDIRVENISAKTVDLFVSTGDTYLTDIQCDNLISKGSTGILHLKHVIAKEKFAIERETGDVKFDCCDAAEILVETDTGNVTGGLLSSKVFITETSTGKINVPKTTTGGKCEITTDTGDIKLELQSN